MWLLQIIWVNSHLLSKFYKLHVWKNEISLFHKSIDLSTQKKIDREHPPPKKIDTFMYLILSKKDVNINNKM